MMYRKIAFFLSVVLFCIHPAFGFSNNMNNAQRLIPVGHWIYDSLIKVEAECGWVSFGQNAPLSVAEIMGYVQEIPYENLSDAGKKAVEEIETYINREYLAIESKALSIGIDPSLSIEFYHKQTDEIPWIYDSYEKQHIIDLPILLSGGNFVFIESDMFLGLNYWSAEEDGVFTNIPYNTDFLEFHFPKTAYISMGIPILDLFSFNFQLGQGRLSVGKTQMGSIILSEYSYSDAYAQFSLYSPKIRYTATTIQLEVNKYLYLHRLELKPIKQVQFGLLEGVLVNAPLELRFLNPLTIFHNYSAWRTYANYNKSTANGVSNTYNGTSRIGSYFGLTFDVNPWKYLRLYGLFGMNQFQTTYEREMYPEVAGKIPNSLGFQGGMETYLPYKEGYFILGFEGLYTNPWMYISEDADWSFYQTRYDIIKNTNTPIFSWIGSPFGPDAIGFSSTVGYDFGSLWSVNLVYQYIKKGEQSFSLFSSVDGSGKNNYYPSSVEEATQKSPTGIPQTTHTVALSGSYSPLNWIDISLKLGYTFIDCFNHQKDILKSGLEVSCSCSIRMP